MERDKIWVGTMVKAESGKTAWFRYPRYLLSPTFCRQAVTRQAYRMLANLLEILSMEIELEDYRS